MKKSKFKKIPVLMLAATLLLSPVQTIGYATETEDSLIVPHEAAYGYFADTYRNNSDSNTTPETNPTIGVLSGFNQVWKPGSDWNNGTILNEEVIRHNIEEAYRIAQSRTTEQAEAAYRVEKALIPRLTLDALGEYKDNFIELSGLGTFEAEWPTKKSKPLYAATYLVRYLQLAANTSPAKDYFDFPRPFRWNVDTLEVIATEQDYVSSLLAPNVPVKETSSGGFPSGHTDEIFLTTYGMAYGLPQKFHEFLMNAAEVGNYRIVAGAHSCLDVMGGRTMATAMAASIFADKDDPNFHLMTDAYQAVQENMFKDVIPAVATLADYEEYQKNLEKFTYYLTYNFAPTGDTTQPMRVPKGAESILATRLPYLDDTQRRYVIYTTGLPSGYPVLDDAEGWGRVNYYKAAAGYSAFVKDVVVNMDASKGAYNAADNWLNDISGEGGLTLKGSGRLALVGKNTFTGGVTVQGGELVMVSDTALGNGNVTVTGGTLSETVDGVPAITGNYEQTGGVLKLTINSTDDILNIAGTATLGGTLIVEIEEGADIPLGTTIVSAGNVVDNFDYAAVLGVEGYSIKVVDNTVVLVDAREVPDMLPPPSQAPAQTPAAPGNLMTHIGLAAAFALVAAGAVMLAKRKKK